MVSYAVITALLAGFLVGVAAQHTFTTAAQAWKDAQDKAEARMPKMRWDG